MGADLHEFAERFDGFDGKSRLLKGRFDWAEEAKKGHGLDRLLAERQDRAKRQAVEKRETELMSRHGGEPLYKTSPEGVDWTKPRNERRNIAAAEQRLVALGFEIQVEGDVRSYVLLWRDLVIYADPRRGNSLHFHVFRGSKRLESFWVLDKTQDPQSRVQTKLEKLAGLADKMKEQGANDEKRH